MNGLEIGTLIALATAFSSIIAVWLQGRRNKSDAIRMINESYAELCEQFRERIEQLSNDLRQAEERITVLEQENRELRRKLAESEAERERLQKEVDELSERLSLYENRPTRTRRKINEDTGAG